ncbi:hypothetical protein LTS18_004530, partial [Coniosporium uncinatum]
TPIDPFSEADAARSSKRRRKSWKDVGVWSYAARNPSPEKDGGEDMLADINSEVSDVVEGRRSAEMQLPRTPISAEDVAAPYDAPKEIVDETAPEQLLVELPAELPEQSDIQDLQSQFTQQLMNQAGGDTEEDTDIETDGSVVEEEEVEEASPPPASHAAHDHRIPAHDHAADIYANPFGVPTLQQSEVRESDAAHDEAASTYIDMADTHSRSFFESSASMSGPTGLLEAAQQALSADFAESTYDPALMTEGTVDYDSFIQPATEKGDHVPEKFSASSGEENIDESDEDEEPDEDEEHDSEVEEQESQGNATFTRGEVIVLEDSDEGDAILDRQADLDAGTPVSDRDDEASEGDGFVTDESRPTPAPSSETTIIRASQGRSMPPPIVPQSELPLLDLQPEPDTPVTPSLHPMDSAGLPFPSPFPGAHDTTASSYMDVYSEQLQRSEPVNLGEYAQLLDVPVVAADADVVNEVDHAEPEQLQIPSSSHRRSRRSSSGYRRENGPFGEQLKMKSRFPFGLDGSMLSRPDEFSSSDAVLEPDEEEPAVEQPFDPVAASERLHSTNAQAVPVAPRSSAAVVVDLAGSDSIDEDVPDTKAEMDTALAPVQADKSDMMLRDQVEQPLPTRLAEPMMVEGEEELTNSPSGIRDGLPEAEETEQRPMIDYVPEGSSTPKAAQGYEPPDFDDDWIPPPIEDDYAVPYSDEGQPYDFMPPPEVPQSQQIPDSSALLGEDNPPFVLGYLRPEPVHEPPKSTAEIIDLGSGSSEDEDEERNDNVASPSSPLSSPPLVQSASSPFDEYPPSAVKEQPHSPSDQLRSSSSAPTEALMTRIRQRTPSDSSPRDSETIRCICSDSEYDGATVLCEICHTWQHIKCFYPSRDLVPDVHECLICRPGRTTRQRTHMEPEERLPGSSQKARVRIITDHRVIKDSEDGSLHSDMSVSTQEPWSHAAEAMHGDNHQRHAQAQTQLSTLQPAFDALIGTDTNEQSSGLTPKPALTVVDLTRSSFTSQSHEEPTNSPLADAAGVDIVTYPELPAPQSPQEAPPLNLPSSSPEIAEERQPTPVTAPHQHSLATTHLPITHEQSQQQTILPTIDMQIEDQQPESGMPPTPQETQVSRKQVTFEETQAMGSPKQKVPMPQRDVSPPSRRVSEIPAALSSWFAPKRRSSGMPKPSATEDVATPQAQRPSREDPESIDIDPALMTTIRHHLTEDLESTQADVHTDAAVRPKPTLDHSLPMSSQTEPPETQRTTLAKFGIGLHTPLSYYTPLTHTYQHLNSTSSTVDILAV